MMSAALILFIRAKRRSRSHNVDAHQTMTWDIFASRLTVTETLHAFHLPFHVIRI